MPSRQALGVFYDMEKEEEKMKGRLRVGDKYQGAYQWFKEYMRTHLHFGGSFAEIRHRVYEHEMGLEQAGLPYTKQQMPPSSWALPKEYVYAYFRLVQGMTHNQAIKRIQQPNTGV